MRRDDDSQFEELAAAEDVTELCRRQSAPQARVRRTTLDLLRELDGAENALRRARSDGNAVVRRWQPSRAPELVLTPGLFPT